VVNINDDIFHQFLIGSGKKPVNWRTFVECLKKSELETLVEEILELMESEEQGNREKRMLEGLIRNV